MSEHSTHCKDPHCYGCSCTPDCDYWDEEPNVLAERERIIKILATMRDTTHEDAWDTLDDAIDAINGVSQNYDIDPVSENPDKEN